MFIIVPIANAKGLLMVGIDGTGLGTLNRLISQNRLPNIQSFLNTRGMLFPMEIHGITFTIPQWAKLFTGLDDYQTGVRGNKSCDDWNLSDRWRIYDTSAHRYRMMECFQRTIPLKQTLQGKLIENGFVSGWFVSKHYLNSNSKTSPFVSIAKNSTHKVVEPGYNENYHRILQNAAITFINNHSGQDFLLFVHLNPDYYGHRFGGETGERYEYEIVRSDWVLGNLLQVIDRDTKVLLVTDHGLDPKMTTHDNADDAWIITDLPIKTCFLNGGITSLDITPTILSWFEIEWREFHRKGKNTLELK